MAYCFQCGESITGVRVFRNTVCAHCDAYLHACVQCRFYEPTAHNQCLEPQSEYVADRQKANFCEFFKLPGASDAKSPGGQPGADRDARAQEARSKLEALFKKPDTS